MRYTHARFVVLSICVPLEESEFNHRNANFMMRSVMRVIHNTD
jgi:hypothetical protein